MKIFGRIKNFRAKEYSEKEKEEWERLEQETIWKFREDAEETVSRLSAEELAILKKMKVLAAVFLLLSFLACWWNLIFGGGACLILAVIWFLIWRKKNFRYSLIFFLAVVMSALYFLITLGFDRLTSLI